MLELEQSFKIFVKMNKILEVFFVKLKIKAYCYRYG